MKIKSIIEYLNKLYDKKLAYDFDNPGLNVGDENDEIKKVLICLDVNKDCIDYAIKENYNFIISHHPMLFYNIKNVNNDRIDTSKIMKLLKNNINIFSMHTNFDVKSKIGMGDIVKEKLFDKKLIKKSSYIENIGEKDGLGCILELKKSISIEDLENLLNSKLNINNLRVYTKNRKDKNILKNIAILPGSGKSDVDTIIKLKPDIFLTGDLSHNNILDLLDSDISFIDCTHYGLEKVFIDFVFDLLKVKFKSIKFDKYYNNYL